MMLTDNEHFKQELDLFRTNVDYLADKADGQFIDLMVRPKSKREKFTAKTYKEKTLERCDWWEKTKKVSIGFKLTHFSGLGAFVLQALDDQFTRWRDLYNLLMMEPPDEDEGTREERKKELQRIRDEQAGWEWFDRRMKCPQCFLPIYVRDINNNYIDLKAKGKRVVCKHKASVTLRKRMKAEREERRKAQKEKKKIPKKDPERYQK